MTLKPVGDLTIFEVGALCEDVKQARTTHPQVELELSEIDKLDAAAIQLLIVVRRSEHCTLTGMTDPIRARMTDLGA
jgi:ABC-type transporter Mla MlaB component